MLFQYLFYAEAIRAYLLYHINSIFGSVGKANEANIYQRLPKREKRGFQGEGFPLSVTEEIIRRDLEGLEKKGLLKRTYGGAIPSNRISLELSFKAREIKHKEEKKTIGKVAAGLIKDGDALMFDAS